MTAPDGLVGERDRICLDQVLTNLLTNAFKYGAGQPVELSEERVPYGVCFSVRDHGIGISQQDVARIFGRFERAVSSRQYGGLGLGLFLTRQIVEAHGGHISLEAAPGKGTTFTVDLPVRRVEAEAQPSE